MFLFNTAVIISLPYNLVMRNKAIYCSAKYLILIQQSTQLLIQYQF